MTYRVILNILNFMKSEEMNLTPAMKKLILHWGEMGSRWGLNRSVAQIYALLYFSPGTLTADEIADTLSLARSNVSTSIRELQGWGVVRVVHELGDRRDHYEALEDLWETLQRVAAERRRRELDPTREVLRETLAQLDEGTEGEAYARERVSDMLEFFSAATAWHEESQRLSPRSLRKLANLAGKIRGLVKDTGGRS